jgi:long-chain acyl-CoA synthetase
MADTISRMFLEQVKRQPEKVAQFSKDKQGVYQPTTYGELQAAARALAAGLLELGVKRGDRVGLISDNRAEWLVTDLALLGLGAADVPRGCDATEQEVRYILSWSECRLTFLENDRQLKKVLAGRSQIPLLTAIVMYEAPESTLRAEAEKAGLMISTYADVIAAGSPRLARSPGEFEAEIAKGKPEDIATLIYTSGTTGDPKGVMLTHANYIYQTSHVVPDVIHVKSGDIFLSVLPIWHSFERIAMYVILAAGAAVAYSKPVGSIMLADLVAIRPQWMASVPRIWESVMDGVYRTMRQTGGIKQVLFNFFVGVGGARAWAKNLLLGRVPEFKPRSRVLDIIIAIIPYLLLSPLSALGGVLVFSKIKEKLGGRFIAGISGGGALPPAVDRFFSALGILILEGYGLTETAPLLSVRPQDRPVPGTVGPAIEGTSYRILDENGKDLPWGKKGLIYVHGPQLMQGYYKRPDLTSKVMHEGGWLDTGDLGMLTRRGEIAITGRAKDTIVLLGGENVEPNPIEQKLCESMYIQQCIVLGQDKKYLAALIIPNQETVTAWAKENVIPVEDWETLIKQPEIIDLIDYEVNELVSGKNGFKSFERLFRFTLLPTPFEVGRELSAKQEVKRHTVNDLYRKEIERLFAV